MKTSHHHWCDYYLMSECIPNLYRTLVLQVERIILSGSMRSIMTLPSSRPAREISSLLDAPVHPGSATNASGFLTALSNARINACLSALSNLRASGKKSRAITLWAAYFDSSCASAGQFVTTLKGAACSWCVLILTRKRLPSRVTS
jgi:hypothetical protein